MISDSHCDNSSPAAPPSLALWNDSASKRAIVRFVNDVSDEQGPRYVPPDERIAVFDNDGTLWCEKPMPVELGFILVRLSEMADHDVALRDRQPWKAAFGKDCGWLEPHRPALRLLLLHDHKAREFAYVSDAEKSLDMARTQGWTIVGMKDDWTAPFASQAPA